MAAATSLDTYQLRLPLPNLLTGTPLAAAAAKSLQSCLTLCDPIDRAHQAPPSLGFSTEARTPLRRQPCG